MNMNNPQAEAHRLVDKLADEAYTHTLIVRQVVGNPIAAQVQRRINAFVDLPIASSWFARY